MSGCMVAAIGLLVVVILGGGVTAWLTYKVASAGKQAMEERMEAHRIEAARIAAKEARKAPVRLVDGKLPDYAAFQPGDVLTREMFLAWRVDQGATTLIRETFEEKVEGAEVSWLLRAGDLREEGGRILGDFYLPFEWFSEDGTRRQSGEEALRCEFAPGERESLLDIRRDRVVEIQGRLSLKRGGLTLSDARQAGSRVEK